MSALYVYGFVSAGAGLARLRGAAAERLRLVSAARVAAVVGRVPSALPVERRTLRAHDAVLRRLAAHADAVLPARFGSALPDEAAVVRLLETLGDRLLPALALVAGREQMTLRISGEPGTPSAPASGPPAGGGPGTRYLAARRTALTAPEADPLRAALSGFVVAERVRRHDRPPLLATLYHLVPRGRATAYAEAVSRAASGVHPLQVAASGPWPPYAFGPEEAP